MSFVPIASCTSGWMARPSASVARTYRTNLASCRQVSLQNSASWPAGAMPQLTQRFTSRSICNRSRISGSSLCVKTRCKNCCPNSNMFGCSIGLLPFWPIVWPVISQAALLVLLPKDGAQRISDFAQGGVGFDGGQDAWHQVLRAARCLAQCRERRARCGIVAALAERGYLRRLPLTGLRVHLQDGRLFLVLHLKFVDADNDTPPGIEVALEGVGSLFNLALDVALLDGADAAAEFINLADILLRLPLQLIGQRFHVIRASQWVNRIRHARLIGQNLLGAQRDTHRILGWQ